MKKTLPLLIVWLLFCGFSCATYDLETNAYKTVGAITITVDGAMNTFGDYVRSGKSTPEQQATVKAAYERYQQAMRATHNAIIAYKTAPQDAAALDTALRAVEAVSGELISVIRQLTTPATP